MTMAIYKIKHWGLAYTFRELVRFHYGLLLRPTVTAAAAPILLRGPAVCASQVLALEAGYYTCLA